MTRVKNSSLKILFVLSFVGVLENKASTEVRPLPRGGKNVFLALVGKFFKDGANLFFCNPWVHGIGNILCNIEYWRKGSGNLWVFKYRYGYLSNGIGWHPDCLKFKKMFEIGLDFRINTAVLVYNFIGYLLYNIKKLLENLFVWDLFGNLHLLSIKLKGGFITIRLFSVSGILNLYNLYAGGFNKILSYENLDGYSPECDGTCGNVNSLLLLLSPKILFNFVDASGDEDDTELS